ncbi:hypothetical protein ACO0SA_001771 [Hanseniaspora valbyensis]
MSFFKDNFLVKKFRQQIYVEQEDSIHILASMQNLNSKFYIKDEQNLNLLSNNKLIENEENQRERLVIKKCCCCGTFVKVFEHSVKYKCTFCKTIVILKKTKNLKTNSLYTKNELEFSYDNSIRNFKDTKITRFLKNLNLQIYMPPDLDNLKDCINLFHEDKNDHNCFNKYVSLCFNYDSLKNSFKNGDKGLDYEALTKYYDTIWNAKSTRSLQNLGFKILLKYSDLLANPETVLTYDFLRCIFIIMECPLVKKCLNNGPPYSKNKQANSECENPFNQINNNVDKKYYLKLRMISFQVLVRCFGYLSNCSEENKDLLIKNIFGKFNKTQFENYINLVNIYINYKLYKILQNDEAKLNATNYTQKTNQISKLLGKPFINDYEADEYIVLDKFTRYTINNNSNVQFPLKTIKLKNYINDIYLLNLFKFSLFLYQTNSKITITQNESIFYNTTVDFIDLQLDFEICNNNSQNKIYNLNSNMLFISNYPHSISVGYKLILLEAHFNKIMNFKLEETFIRSLNFKMVNNLYFHLIINRFNMWKDTVKQLNDELELYKTLKCIQTDSMNEESLQFEKLAKMIGFNMHKPMRVEFLGEPGLDASGLKREWFHRISLDIFSSRNGFFVDLDNRKIWFPNDEQSKERLTGNMDYYFIFGVIFGLSIFNCVNGTLPFPITFYKKLYEIPLSIRDFEDVYPQQYSYLISISKMSEEEFKQMDLRFEVNFFIEAVKNYDNNNNNIYNKENFEKKIKKKTIPKTIELIKNGSNISVNSQNKIQFIKHYMNYYLNLSIEKSFSKFLKGFKIVITDNIPFHLISYFEMYQMYNNGINYMKTNEQLMSNETNDLRYELIKMHEIDLLATVTKYVNEGKVDYKNWTLNNSETIRWFWEIVKEQTDNDIKKNVKFESCFFFKLLLFITGNGNIPLCGISSLEFKISKINNPRDKNSSLFPIAHTCFNELCLYENYISKAHLLESLQTSIAHTNSAYGFR